MAATKRKVVEKSKVGKEPEPEKKETKQPQPEEASTPKIKETSSNTDNCIFVKLSDGVMIDLMEIQGYVHEEDTMGRVFLKGGNSFPTPCGDELVKLIRKHRMFS